MNLFLFLVSLVVVIFSSGMLTRILEKIGVRFRLSEALLGLFTALGANSPEICSGIFAIYRKQHDLGLGVILGSNIINLAGLLGLGALIVGRVEIRLQSLLTDGIVGFITTVIVACLVVGVIPLWQAFFLFALVFFPYLFFISRRPNEIERWSISSPLKRFMLLVARDSLSKERVAQVKVRFLDYFFGFILLALVIVGSFALVDSAVALAVEWGIPHVVVGTLILAGLTSIPNMVSAVLLARDQRGAAVVSETFNSNTLNILTGICLPLLIFGMGTISSKIRFSLAWLLGMTLLAILLTSFHKGLHRMGGAILIACYLAYAAVILL